MIIVSSKLLSKYRKSAKAAQIWDEGYDGIKKDLSAIYSRVMGMNKAYDLAGVFAEQTILAFRLLTYGESTSACNEEDIKAILTPLADIFNGPELSSKISSDYIGFIKAVLPVASNIITELKIDSANEFRDYLRIMLIKTSGLMKIVLGRMMALDYCLYSYGMVDLRDVVAEKAKNLVDNSPDKDVIQNRSKVEKIFLGTAHFPPNRFIINMSIVLNETNLGHINYEVAEGLMNDIETGIIQRGHKYDCLQFMESPGFMNFANSALKFHHVEPSVPHGEKD